MIKHFAGELIEEICHAELIKKMAERKLTSKNTSFFGSYGDKKRPSVICEDFKVIEQIDE